MIFCSLYSGSSGNSILVGSKNTKILIDAGLSGKKIIEGLQEVGQDPNEIEGIFITHEHSDHIKGAGILSRKFNIPIYANELTWKAMEKSLGKIKEENKKIIAKRSTISLNDIDIISFNTPHDSVASTGYTIKSKEKSVSIATDIGTFTEEILKNIRDSEVILLEANHDVQMLKFGPYPYDLKRRVLSEVGHLSNEDCGHAIVDIMKSGLNKKIILGHLSNTNNVPELAEQAVKNVLSAHNLEVGKDLELRLADRNKPSNYISF